MWLFIGSLQLTWTAGMFWVYFTDNVMPRGIRLFTSSIDGGGITILMTC